MSEKQGIYTVFGLVFESEIDLPELLVAEGQADVKIIFGKTPESLEDPKVKTPWYQLAQGQFLLQVEGVARYYVENGDLIRIEPGSGAKPEDIRVFLLHTVLAALLHQRDYLVLHGAAAVVNGKAVAFVGPSDTGKTAIALDLYDRGYQLLSDEICAIKNQNDKAVVFPGFPQLYVWSDTLTQAEKDVQQYQPIRQGIKKYLFPVDLQFSKTPVELGNVILLSSHNQTEDKWELLKGVAGFEQMLLNTYFMETVVDKVRHFKIAAAIGKNAHLYRLTFNGKPYRVNEITEFINKQI